MQKNVSGQKIGAQMISAADGSAFTGAVTVYITGDAGTQAVGSVGSGACTHEGNGYHTYAPAQAETNYNLIACTFTGTGAVPVTVQIETKHDANVIEIGGSAQSLADLKDFADDGYDPSTNKVQGVVLVDTATTLTNDPTGVGTLLGRLTSTRAGYLDNLSGGAVALASALSTLQTDVTTLLTRLTSARAGYLDNLNVGGAVASQADITALNQSASRRIILTSVEQYERPESGTTSYLIEARTYDGDGASVNADTTPTLTATGVTSGSLAANLSSASNPSTGVYRWTYSVASDATTEQIRFDISATISSSTFTLPMFSQVCDFVSATYTTADRTKLTAIYDKLPSKTYLTGTSNSDGDVQLDEATGTPADSAGTTTLLSRLSAARAGYLDNLSAGAVATASALATAASNITSILGKFTGITLLAQWIGALAGKQTPNSTAVTEINATGAGGGTFNPVTDSLEAVQEELAMKAEPGAAMTLDLSQALDTTPADDTVGQALMGSAMEGFGDETNVGTTWTKKAPGGSTQAVFETDDADAPTERVRQ